MIHCGFWIFFGVQVAVSRGRAIGGIVVGIVDDGLLSNLLAGYRQKGMLELLGLAKFSLDIFYIC